MAQKNYLSKNNQASTIILIVSILIISFLIDIFNNSQLFTPLIISTILSAVITYWSSNKLKKLKLNQIIRLDGPQSHLTKSGTPTMGGLFIIPIGIAIGNIFNFNENISKDLISISFLTLAYMTIGIFDDWQNFTANQNTGLKAKDKLTLQIIMATIFLIYCLQNNLIDTNIFLYFNNSIEFGLFIIPISLFILVAEANATNLTDGLDGLASGCAAIVCTGLSIELTLRGDIESLCLASFCMSMTGVWLGFLIHNKHPAKIFMGDTGSLSIGAYLAGIGLISNSLWVLFLMGGVFLLEAISVIIQVSVFKITKQIRGKGLRVFAMAPLHHHFELKGKNEVEIVQKFWIASILFVGIGLLFRSNF